MKGSIVTKKVGKKTKYYAIVDLPRLPEEKRKQKWSSGFDKKRDAEAELVEMLIKYRKADPVTSKNLLLKNIAEDYLEKNEAILAKSTLKRYKSCVKELIKELGEYKVQELDPYVIEQYFKKLKQKGLQPATLSKHKVVLQQICHYAKELRIIQNSPIPQLKTAAANKYEHETWSVEEIRSFLAHVKGESIYWPVLIASSTGMRLGEVIALRWKDIDLEKGMINVTKSKDLDNTLKSPKNKSSRRPIKIMSNLLVQLKELKVEQKKLRMKYGNAYKVTDFVCTLDDGQPLKANYVSIMFKRKCEQYNYTYIKFHGLRHSFATIALSNNVNPKVVQEILGHSTIKTTLDTYSHVLPHVHGDSMSIIEEAFGG